MRVLIVDDEREIRELLAQTLEGAGFEAVEADSGEQALVTVDKIRVDLVITDLWMPGINGVELLQELEKRHLGMEVIVLSAHVTEATKQKMDSLGAFAVLTKPFDTAELISTVKEAAESNRTVRALLTDVKVHGPTKARILVTDDEPEVRNLLRSALEEAGYEVEEAADGIEAREKMLASDFALVLLDINMPRMGGIEVIKEASKMCPGAFFVVITGEATEEEMQKAVRAGAYKCLRKPLKLDELVAELPRLELIAGQRRRALERRKAREETIKAHPLWRKVAERLRGRQRHKTKFVATIVLAMLACAALGAAVPTLFRGLSAAADAAGDKIQKYEGVIDRVEGYLDRDEKRELKRERR